MPQDQRLVQTAVLGSAESEIPVMLPVQAVDVGRFRTERSGETFWCGRWLGGCGARLTTKLYEDRACHFAHVPDPARGPCRRAAVGIFSADHLYIRQQILSWLADQDIAALARMPEGVRAGGEVLFDPAAYRCLRVLLDQEAAAPPAVEGTQTVLGPGVAYDPHQMTVHGYVLRIRCDTVGTRRRVMIGTQLRFETQWFALEECRLEPWGLSTPAVEDVRRLRTTHQPLTGPPSRGPSPVGTGRPVVAPQAQVDRSAAFTGLQRAVDNGRGVSELRHCLNLAEAAVLGGATAEENALLRAAADLLLCLERGVGVSAPAAPARRKGQAGRRPNRPSSPAPQAARNGSRQAAQAVSDLLNTLNRRRGHLTLTAQKRLVERLDSKAEEAGHWLSGAQRAEITIWKSKPLPAPRPAVSTAPLADMPVRNKDSSRDRRRPAQQKIAPPSRPTSVEDVAEAARDVLEHAARLGKTVPFSQLCAQVKGLAALSTEQQHDALARISRPRQPVPLAVLITTEDNAPHPHVRHLIDQAGPQRPDDEIAVRASWQQTVVTVHKHYRPSR